MGYLLFCATLRALRIRAFIVYFGAMNVLVTIRCRKNNNLRKMMAATNTICREVRSKHVWIRSGRHLLGL
jgi:hypothetical protein